MLLLLLLSCSVSVSGVFGADVVACGSIVVVADYGFTLSIISPAMI